MAARQDAIGGKTGGAKERRIVHTIAESAAAGTAAAEAAAMPAGWKPSRFFGAWKKMAAKTTGLEIYWFTLGHCKALAPDAREQIVDSVLRITTADGCRPDDFYEGVLASHDDYAAMQAFAAALVDAFWGDFWACCREPA